MTDMLADGAGERDARSMPTPRPASRAVADALFLLQCTFATGFGVSQFIRMLTSVEGVSITWMAFWAAFLVVNLGLAVRAGRVFPSRIARQTIVVYALWTALCGANLALLLMAGATWTAVDSVTAAIVLAGVASTLAVARARRLRFLDARVQAAFAVFSKSVPQLTLAWNLGREGAAGLSPVAIVAGHLTIGLRLWQIGLSIREAGWDRNRLALAVGEAANEASWIVVTLVWWLR